ncbi:thioredoxin domain-containing protein [Eremomyces bilateralis CBS 781.70]|uniref:Thioredoxin domain-containing protein n=1 Tax=Eremomyces bilateralis CBS 781.70 TaxID=1392243 RepID=A0A6G1GCJ4_9PEZI|nr:thioredoxin domain-containing protein [Eremomyces bilateralis CBS 781.70]KAF1815754.1 thioredoxin domain-containing protein [Eremomyces bilateralis CBS 781.70]
MDVQLYVYDISRVSQQFLGTQIDAVYHTSIVLNNVEYYFGQGVQQSYPGTTHHGEPMEVLHLGKTEIPMDVILDYLQSLKQVYTPESYDLLLNNCNNFTHDLSTFLVGKGIPDHITGLPETFMNSPFGYLLRPQLDLAMQGITQAPTVPTGASPSAPAIIEPATQPSKSVHEIDSNFELEELLSSASKTCAVIFFTSSTCAPCKLVYPAFDELAEEAGKWGVFIKIDLNRAYQVAARYGVRATPTFITFLKGQKDEEWTGANETDLRGKVRLLLQRATFHPHQNLDLGQLIQSSTTLISFSKVPPLDKLIQKLGDSSTDPAVLRMKTFLTNLNTSTPQNNPMPDIHAFNIFLAHSLRNPDPTSLFAVYDLLRLALNDPRIAAAYAAPQNFETITALISHVTSGATAIPYNLRLITLHLSCNLFPHHALRTHALSNPRFTTLLSTLLTTSLLDLSHTTTRIAAASLAFNLAASNVRARIDGAELFDDGTQTEMVAGIVEAVRRETESQEAAKGLIMALGLWVYCADVEGEVVDLVKVLEAGEVVGEKRGLLGAEDGLVKGVERLLRS